MKIITISREFDGSGRKRNIKEQTTVSDFAAAFFRRDTK